MSELSPDEIRILDEIFAEMDFDVSAWWTELSYWNSKVVDSREQFTAAAFKAAIASGDRDQAARLLLWADKRLTTSTKRYLADRLLEQYEPELPKHLCAVLHMALSSNPRGRRAKGSQLQKARRFLERNPEASNRQIAGQAGVSAPTVARWFDIGVLIRRV